MLLGVGIGSKAKPCNSEMSKNSLTVLIYRHLGIHEEKPEAPQQSRAMK